MYAYRGSIPDFVLVLVVFFLFFFLLLLLFSFELMLNSCHGLGSVVRLRPCNAFLRKVNLINTKFCGKAAIHEIPRLLF